MAVAKPAKKTRRIKVLRKRIGQGISSVLIAALIALSGMLTLPTKRRVGRFAGRLLFAVARKRRKKALRSIEVAYGDSLTTEEKQRIARESIENLGIVAMEFSHLSKFLRAGANALVRIEGLERYDSTKGCVAISGHMSNWEWLAPALAAHRMPIAEVVQSYAREPYAAALNALRERAGVHTVPEDRAAFEARKLLAKGYVFGILIDRSPRETGVPATFFGKECWATSGPAFIALRAKVPVYFIALNREPDGSYVLRFSEVPPPAPSGSFRDDVRAFTQLMQDAMEKHVREYPGQWFWMTNRWRRREQLEAKWNARAAGEAGESVGGP